MSPAGRRFMEKLAATPRFAHHPACDCYESHLLYLGGSALCLGCTCMVTGAIVTSLMLGAYWSLSGLFVPTGWDAMSSMAAIGVGLYLPTLMQPFCQRKLFKVLSRVMLGAAMPVLGIAGLVAPPLAAAGFVVRIFFLIAFWNAARATLAYRARFTPNPCARCLPKTFPFCDGNRARLASLFKEFEQSAGPEDADFIAFASAITNTPSMVSIETIRLEDFQT